MVKAGTRPLTLAIVAIAGLAIAAGASVRADEHASDAASAGADSRTGWTLMIQRRLTSGSRGGGPALATLSVASAEICRSVANTLLRDMRVSRDAKRNAEATGTWCINGATGEIFTIGYGR